MNGKGAWGMERTRVGLIGTGWIAGAHLEALRRLETVHVVAVCGRDAARTRAFAQRHGIEGWYTDVEGMLRDAALDAVHGCTNTASHDAVNRAAIAHGKHLYAEKPLSDSAAAAHETWRMAERAGIVHGLNHQYRMNAAVQEMRVRVKRGDAGGILLAHGRYHQQSGLYRTDFKPRMRERGVTWALSDIGTHWVDTACCVLGRRVEQVLARVVTVYPERELPDGTPVAVATDDLCTALLRFEGGAEGSCTISKVSAGHMNDLALAVDGTKMSMAWRQEAPGWLSIGHKGRPNELLQVEAGLLSEGARDLAALPGGHAVGWTDALAASIAEFYRAVRGEIAPSAMRCATLEDGFEGMAFVEAAVRSSASGTWVRLAR